MCCIFGCVFEQECTLSVGQTTTKVALNNFDHGERKRQLWSTTLLWLLFQNLLFDLKTVCKLRNLPGLTYNRLISTRTSVSIPWTKSFKDINIFWKERFPRSYLIFFSKNLRFNWKFLRAENHIKKRYLTKFLCEKRAWSMWQGNKKWPDFST